MELMEHDMRPLIAVAMLSVCAAVHAAEAEWGRFRGPDGLGISAAATIPVKWTENDYNWKVALPGMGHSSPVVCGNHLYVTSADAETARRTLLCIDTADGRTLWKREDESHPYKQHTDNGFATATPAADADGVVITWTTPEEVALLALAPDGREVWRRNLGPFISVHGSGTSPIIFERLVVLANEQEDPTLRRLGPKPGKSFLIAVDRKTGETRWQVERRTALAPYSTPCVYRPEGGPPELVFSSMAHGITGVDARTGKVNWEIDGIFKDRCTGSPVAADGLAFASYGYGSKGTRFVAARPGREKGVETTIAYDVTRNVPLVPTPIVKDGRLFLWCDDGTVTCLKASTGELVWREKAGAQFYGSPVWVDGRLYAIAKNGDVVVIAAADKFEVLARVSLGEASFSTPAVSGGVMYLRTQSHLFSLGGKKP